MSALVNGGHGRRIREDKSEVSKRSQVPVSKVDWDHQKRVALWDDRLSEAGRWSHDPDKKQASRTVGNDSIKGLLAGAAAGGGAGAAIAHYAKKPKLNPALLGALAGEITGGGVGRSRGIRRAERQGHLKRVDDAVTEASKAFVEKGAWDKIDHGLTRAAQVGLRVEEKAKLLGEKSKKAHATVNELRKPGAVKESLRHRAGKKVADVIEPEVKAAVNRQGKRVIGAAAATGVVGAAGGSYLGNRAGNYPGGAKGFVNDKRNQGARLVATGRDRTAEKLAVDKALIRRGLLNPARRAGITRMDEKRKLLAGKKLKAEHGGGERDWFKKSIRWGAPPFKFDASGVPKPKLLKQRKKIEQSAVVAPGRPKVIGKADRYYDPETNRQRRSGMVQAAMLGGGAAVLATTVGRKPKAPANGKAGRIGSGIRGETARVRSTKHHIDPKDPSKGTKDTYPKHIAMKRRHIAQLAGGTALVSGAGAEQYHSTHARGQAWS